MNWYKKAQLNKYAGKGMWTAMGWIAIPAIVALLGISAFDVENKLQNDPEELAQEVQQKQMQETPQVQKPEQPKEQVENLGPQNIDLDKIWQIESTKGTNPNMGRSSSGARGHFQFMEGTWNELVQKMGKNWDWFNDSMNYEKSRQVADYYLNKRIPQMLNYYKIPDNIETRLGAYNWGIGNIKREWEQHGDKWLDYSPTETQEYVNIKYR